MSTEPGQLEVVSQEASGGRHREADGGEENGGRRGRLEAPQQDVRRNDAGPQRVSTGEREEEGEDGTATGQ